MSRHIVVLIDDDLWLYRQVITGIHVASSGNYRVLHLHEEGFVQSALLEQLIAIKPRALIALGPRSANAVHTARIILPSAFSMVPRMDNYQLNDVFSAGIRMIPDVQERLTLVRSLLPEVKSLGVVFSKTSSRDTMHQIRALCDDEQIELVNIEVQSSSDVLPALRRYGKQFSALLMLDDPVLMDARVIRSLIEFLSSHDKALFALDCSMVQEGALASFGTNLFRIGQDLVKAVERKRNSRIFQPTVFLSPNESDLCINLTTAQKLIQKDKIITRAVNYSAKRGIVLRSYK